MNVFNRQRRLHVDRKGLISFLQTLGERLDLVGGFSVALISDRRMRQYNRDFVGSDYPTDVLSFPAEAGDDPDEAYLGDIVISVERADAQKEGTLADELNRLSLHGLLHLLGYDHETDGGRMARYESRLRREFGL